MPISPIIKRFEMLRSEQRNWEDLYEEAYQYTMPERGIELGETDGQNERAELYDSTATDSLVNLANRLQDSLVPPFSRWAQFISGRLIPDEQKDEADDILHRATIQYFDVLQRTNFKVEINPALMDIGIGMAGLVINASPKPDIGAVFSSIPAHQLIVDEGPEGTIDTVFREHDMAIRNVKETWEGARFDDTMDRLLREKPDDKIRLIEGVFPNFSTGLFEYHVFAKKGSFEIFNDKDTTSPWVVPRWSKIPGRSYGRGPVLFALSDIKSLNVVIQMILENASLEVAGMYTAVDDGVLNVDSIEIAPGITIPVASNGGTVGPSLARLPGGQGFDLTQISISELRQSIRRKLQDDSLSPLDGTVRSAEEVRLRNREFAKSIGSSFGRLQNELLGPIITRTLDLFSKKGLMPELKVDGDIIDIKYTSPLVQLQNDADMESLQRSLANMNAFQPGLAQIAYKTGFLAKFIHAKSGAQPDLIRSAEEIEQLIASATQSAIENPEGAQAVQGLIGA